MKVWTLLSEGVYEVARVVAKTYGPAGGKVMVSKNRSVLVTTDGAALTRESQLGGTSRLGAKLVRTAALQTEREVGDGTSTTVLLTGALVKGIGRLAAAPDWNPVRVVEEIRDAARVADAFLGSISEDPDREVLSQVARMAAHGEDLIAEKVVEAVLSVGEEGSVVISPYEGTGIVLEQKEGLYLSQGWASFEMCPEGASEREMDGPLVAVFRQPLRRVEDVSEAMSQASQWPGRGLLVFAPSVQGDALATLILNDKKGVLPCAAVEYRGSPVELPDWLEDLTTVTNATLVDPDRGLLPEKFEAPWLGYARKAVLSRDRTLLVSYLDEEILKAIDLRAAALRARAEASPHPYDRDRLGERASALDGGLCTLRVGGLTKQEGQDRRSRVEDALRAVQGALRAGVVPGAGRAYLGALRVLPETEGAFLLGEALKVSFRVLAERAGREPETILEEGIPSDEWWGWDPVQGDWRDFRSEPKIADPTEVSRSALRNAVSVASQIALCGGVVPGRSGRSGGNVIRRRK